MTKKVPTNIITGFLGVPKVGNVYTCFHFIGGVENK